MEIQEEYFTTLGSGDQSGIIALWFVAMPNSMANHALSE
jgi:hypothetical protein